MLKDLHDELFYIFVFYYLLLKIQCAYFFHSRSLMVFLGLVKHLRLIVQEFVYQLLKVLLDVVKHY
jgi:hypothetical protein